MKTEELKRKMTVENARDFLCDMCYHNYCAKDPKECNASAITKLEKSGWFGRIFIEESKRIYKEMIDRGYSSINSDSVKTMMNAIEYLEKRIKKLEDTLKKK